MRFKITVTRVQTADRYIRAATEAEAIAKVQHELELTYGFLGSWNTTATDIDIVDTSAAFGDLPDEAIKDGPMLLSTKAAAKYLGITYNNTLYALISDGEIAHLRVGRRIYITREHINAFIEANTRTSLYG